MTNYEYWKGVIQAIWDKNSKVGITKNEVPCDCYSINCHDCIMFDEYEQCEEKKFKWLMAEHVDKPELTKKERQFCELVETGYIARDFNGIIYFYRDKPVKKDRYWYRDGEGNCKLGHILFSDDHFKFIDWTDKEPWSIEDLLKLEVRE